MKNGFDPKARRALALWLGSFLIVVSFLYFHFGVPLLPLVLGGVLTLGISIFRMMGRNSIHSTEARIGQARVGQAGIRQAQIGQGNSL